MARAKRAEPKSPEQIAAEKAIKRAAAEALKEAKVVDQRKASFASVGVQADAAVLVANEAVHIRSEGRKNLRSARRLDVFETLRKGMDASAYGAVRQLERDIIVRRGEHDRGAPSDRVDNGRDKGREQRMLEAGQRVDKVLARLGRREARLLSELIAPSRDYEGWTPMIRKGRSWEPGAPLYGWRAVVGFITGELLDAAQAAVVRAACINLRDQYEARKEAA